MSRNQALGVALLVGVVAVVLLTSPTWHASAASTASAAVATPSARPSMLAVAVATMQPAAVPKPAPVATARPSPETWDLVIGGLAHLLLSAWLLAFAVLPLGALTGVALHMRYHSRLLILERPPLRDREAVHRAYDWRQVEAGGAPESATMDQTGHRSPMMLRRYVRLGSLFRQNAAAYAWPD